jgi:Family of unknown function (DUF6788)
MVAASPRPHYNQPSNMKRQRQLEAKLERVRQQLTQLGNLQPGSMSKQYNVCGKPQCQCKASPPKKHGPYYQLSFTWKGRSKTKFVRREHVATVRQELRNYRRLRELVDQWIELELELSQLRLQEGM